MTTARGLAKPSSNQADILTMVPLLFLVVVMDRWSDVVLSTAQGMCARFGLRRGPLFAGACACSFACSWVFSSAVASVALLYFLDRVLTTTFRENMDQAQDGGALWSPSPHRHGALLRTDFSFSLNCVG